MQRARFIKRFETVKKTEFDQQNFIIEPKSS